MLAVTHSLTQPPTPIGPPETAPTRSSRRVSSPITTGSNHENPPHRHRVHPAGRHGHRRARRHGRGRAARRRPERRPGLVRPGQGRRHRGGQRSRGRRDPGARPTPDAPPRPRTASVRESVLTRDTDGADVVGVGFPDRASAEGVTVEVRSRQDGSWGRWTGIGLSDSAPDPGTAEARQAKVATEPVGVTGSDEVQVRVRTARAGARLERLTATFVDGGTSAADGTVLRTPAASASAAAAQPTLVSRAAWGADESLRTCTPGTVTSIKGAIVHHTVNSNTLRLRRRAGPPPRHLRVPRQRQRLVRRRLQLLRRPVRPALRGSLRRHVQERRRRPGGRASTRRPSGCPRSATTTRPAPGRWRRPRPCSPPSGSSWGGRPGSTAGTPRRRSATRRPAARAGPRARSSRSPACPATATSTSRRAPAT